MKIPAAPWHRPKKRYVGNGVYVTDIYGSHLIAALIHWLFVALRRRWKRPAQNQDRTREVVDPATNPRMTGATIHEYRDGEVGPGKEIEIESTPVPDPAMRPT